MNFLVAAETWVPLGDSQFHIEKWVPEDDFLFQVNGDGYSNGDRPWAVRPYYVLFKLDGTQLMDTTDWSQVVAFLQAVLGEKEIPEDFFL